MVLDTMLIWQVFGGIAMPAGDLEMTLKTLNEMITSNSDFPSLMEMFDEERMERMK